MLAAAQTSKGLIAMGAQHKDIRGRFLSYAADYFGTWAKGEKPPKPEKFMAEVVAEVVAETVGADVPMPLGEAVKRPYTKKGGAGPAPRGEILPDDGPPTGPIELMPEAETWLRSHGVKLVFKSSCLMLSAFLKYPRSWWSTAELAKRLHRSVSSTTGVIRTWADLGIVLKRGDRGSSVRWKLAETPPHV